MRSLGDDLAKLSLIDVVGWNHDTIIAPAVASRDTTRDSVARNRSRRQHPRLRRHLRVFRRSSVPRSPL